MTITVPKTLRPSSQLRSFGRKVLACIRTLLVKTDVARWQKTAYEVPSWDERNRIIATFIPENSSVLDLGAGARLLGNYLKHGCSYQACDIIQSAPDVLLCDFNLGEYPNVSKRYDYVVCSGLLEYIRDPASFFSHIKGYGDRIILTYNLHLQYQSRVSRLSKGWVNHLTETDLRDLFSAFSLTPRLLDCQQETQVIFELKTSI